MTGLLNRRKLTQRMEDLRELHAREQVASSLILLDIDDFKRINHTYGHPAGGAVILSVATAPQASVRRPDLVFGYGGDELLILLPPPEAPGVLARSAPHRCRPPGHGAGVRRHRCQL